MTARELRLRKRIDQLTDERDRARSDLAAARKKLRAAQSALCAARKARDTAKAHVAYVRDLERRRFRYTRKVSTKAAA